jgi:hypothetical protein
VNDRRELAAILAVWAAAVAFIRPRGEFPLVDDWDFTIATWNFARTGHFHFTPFTATSLRAMVLWGAAWTRTFGESFLVLRLSTLTLAAAALILIHRILLRGGVPRVGRVVATLAFAFHPVFLWASCTYMTEVPFLCASAGAFVLIWRGLSEERPALLAAGCVAAMVACFVRQTGIVILVAPLAVVLLLRDAIGARWRRAAAILASFALLFAAIFVVKPEWLAGSLEEFASHAKMWREPSFRLPQQIAVLDHYAVFNAQNCGLFFLPLVVPLALGWRRRRRWAWALLAGVALVILVRVQHLVNAGMPMPYFAFAPMEDIFQGNVFNDFGLGAPSLSDVWSTRYPYPFHLTPFARLLVTYGSVAAGALMVTSILVALKRATLLLTLAVALAFTGTVGLMGAGIYADRYSLDSAWSIGIALALIVPWEKRMARAAAIVALSSIAIFSTFSVQEYFAWNRARWQAFHALRNLGIAVADIDGGNEPKSWYEVSKMNRDQARKAIMFQPARPYRLAFRPLPGYAVIGRVPFEGWLGWHRGAIYAMRLSGTSG